MFVHKQLQDPAYVTKLTKEWTTNFITTFVFKVRERSPIESILLLGGDVLRFGVRMFQVFEGDWVENFNFYFGDSFYLTVNLYEGLMYDYQVNIEINIC